jgi:hypothetical protein
MWHRRGADKRGLANKMGRTGMEGHPKATGSGPLIIVTPDLIGDYPLRIRRLTISLRRLVLASGKIGMAKVFEQFHFSLIEREQMDMLDPDRTREEWLRARLDKGFTFYHHGNTFHWVPKDISREFIVGIIERQKFQLEMTPPDEGADEVEGSFWTGSMVVIDPNNRPDGQKVAVEDNQHVGQPNALLNSFVAHLNKQAGNQYALHFKALFRGDSFHRFANKHGGQLEFVRFRFTVPNMIFSAGGGVKKGLERIGNDTNAQEVEIKIESDDGIDANSKAVKEGVAYAEGGNAKVSAKALNGDKWYSTNQKLTVKMHSILNFSKAKAGEVQKWLKQALDRDSDSGDSSPDNSDGSDSGN